MWPAAPTYATLPTIFITNLSIGTAVAPLRAAVVPMSDPAIPSRKTRPIALLFSLVLAALALAGCHEPLYGEEAAQPSYSALGFDGHTWPRLDGETLTILDHGAFAAFDSAAAAFEELTGIHVVHMEAADTGSMLNRAILEAGDPSFDIIYGVDNILLKKALDEHIFAAYEPLGASSIDPAYLFFDADHDGWYATPVDHGYIGLNVDVDHASLADATIVDLFDVRHHADTFVTQDPRTSTPGLGFMLATIGTYGQATANNPYSWHDYWNDLFEGGVLVTADWSTAYMGHFSAAGEWVGESARDRAIVTSYTESPAYEGYFGMPPADLAAPMVVDSSTFHQIQTMAIARGTHNMAAAQAWIEFTLTDAFQVLAAPENAVYPVTTSAAAAASVAETYGDLDPEPGTFAPAAIPYETIGDNLERWIGEWVERCEAHDCA